MKIFLASQLLLLLTMDELAGTVALVLTACRSVEADADFPQPRFQYKKQQSIQSENPSPRCNRFKSKWKNQEELQKTLPFIVERAFLT